uniref:Uncharacterized protein n=1 Tax=Hucho hucho TaxID=62062 RepID=A0A4W5JLL1_9TELE
MPIQSFSFPLPETRFFQAGQHVYKFKIRGGNTCRCVMGEEFVNRELENAIRAVLANLDCLQPFTTTHFTVYPSKGHQTPHANFATAAENNPSGKHYTHWTVSSHTTLKEQQAVPLVYSPQFIYLSLSFVIDSEVICKLCVTLGNAKLS